MRQTGRIGAQYAVGPVIDAGGDGPAALRLVDPTARFGPAGAVPREAFMRILTRFAGAGRVARILGAVALLAAVLSPPANARKAFHAEAYHVTLRVQPDGSVMVREEIRIRFAGGPFTFFYRGIPSARTDGIVVVGPSDSTRIRTRKRRVEVTWNFVLCRDTTRTFVVEYLARGVLYDEDGHRRLRWSAFPSEHPYRIEAASVAILFPPGTPPPISFITKPVDRALREARPWAEEPALDFGPALLAENRTVVLQVDLPPGALSGPEPAWRLARLRWRDHLPGVLAVTGAFLVLGLSWVLRARSELLATLAPGTAGGRVNGAEAFVNQPPEEISPALSGALLLGQPELPQAFAVLFDLTRRGVLRLDPGGTRGRWVSPRPKVRRGVAPGDLQPWERIVLDAVFERSNTDGSADWRHVVSTLSRRFRNYTGAVQEGLVRHGAFDPAGLEGRRAMQRGLLLLLVVEAAAAIAGILLTDQLGPAAFLPLGATTAVLVGVLVTRAAIPVRTQRGVELARAWKGFARYLKNASKGSTPVDAARFAAWLPHALSLGAGPPWAKAAQRGGVEPPVWFRSDSGDITGDMRALTSIIAIAAAAGGRAGSAGSGDGAGGGGSSGAG
jgi:hypothetical protein